MSIIFLPFISRAFVRANPEARFVFGDNLERSGYGGQAGAMRGEPNAIGVATKAKPSMDPDAFFEDSNHAHWLAVQADLMKIEQALAEDRVVYVPKDGLGTGLSQLPQRAPRIYEHIFSFFQNEFANSAKTTFPWPTLSALQETRASA